MDIENRIRELREELAALESYRPPDGELGKYAPPEFELPSMPETLKPYMEGGPYRPPKNQPPGSVIKNMPYRYGDQKGGNGIKKMPYRYGEQTDGPAYGW